jgi:hypothetical protein
VPVIEKQLLQENRPDNPLWNGLRQSAAQARRIRRATEKGRTFHEDIG